MAKITLTDLVSGFLSKAGLNNNFQQVEDELNNNVLYRNNPGTEPNQMEQFLDMNSNRVVNVGTPVAGTDALRLKDITDTDKTSTAAATSIEDTSGYYDTENVEAALQEIWDDLGDTANGEGASRIAIEDSGGFYSATDVEATLQEIGPHIQEVVADVATLQTGSFETGIERIWLSGYYGLGTPGGGALYRDAADTTTADNGGTVFVDADSVRWKRPVAYGLNEQRHLTDLRSHAASDIPDNFVVYLHGRSSVGDGGGGYFYWDSSNLSTEVGSDEVTANEGDGGIYVAPTSDKTGASGAWVRQDIHNGSPEMYGAVGDGDGVGGGTDDLIPIQTALDNLDVVHLTPGKVYNISSTLFIPSNTTLVCDPHRSSTLYMTTDATSAIRLVTGVEDSHIIGVVIDNVTDDLAATEVFGIQISECFRIVVENCSILTSDDAGIRVGYDVGGTNNPAEDCIITGNYIQNILGGSGVELINTTRAVVENNSINSVFQYGVRMVGARWCRVINNYIEGAEQIGIYIARGSSQVCRENSVADNIILVTDDNARGIRLFDEAESIAVTGNVIRDTTGQTGTKGIVLDQGDAGATSACRYCTIHSNTVANIDTDLEVDFDVFFTIIQGNVFGDDVLITTAPSSSTFAVVNNIIGGTLTNNSTGPIVRDNIT